MNLKSPVIRRNGVPQGHCLRRAKDARFHQGGQKLRFMTSLMLFAGGKRNRSYCFIGDFFVFAPF